MFKSKFALIVFIYVVFITRAGAADFTFNVPVELANMPSSITAVVVRCKVLCVEPGGPSLASLNREEIWNAQAPDNGVIGTGQQVRSINTSTGYLNTTLTVNIDTAPELYPNNAGNGYCLMKIRDENGQESFPLAPGAGNSPFAIGAGGSMVSGLGNDGIFPLQNLAQVGTGCDNPDPTQ